MYVGVKLLSALYANIALLYINRLGIDCQLNWSNISRDGVIKSAFKIIRAARF